MAAEAQEVAALARKEAERIAAEAQRLAALAKEKIEWRLRVAKARKHFTAEALSYSNRDREAFAVLAAIAKNKGIKDQVIAAFGVQSRGDGDDSGPIVALVNDLRNLPAFNNLETIALAQGYHSITLMVGCGAGVGLGLATGASLARGVAWSPRGSEFAFIREAALRRGGVNAGASCDVALGWDMSPPSKVNGSNVGISFELHVGWGAGASYSWNTSYSGYRDYLPNIYSTQFGGNILYMYDQWLLDHNNVKFAGASASIGLGLSYGLFSLQYSDSYVRVLNTEDPRVVISAINFSRSSQPSDKDYSVEISNIGETPADISDYVLVVNADVSAPIAITTGANNDIEDELSLDENCPQIADEICMRQHRTIPIPILQDLEADGSDVRVALYSSLESFSADTLVDEQGWGQEWGPCSPDAIDAYINCGTCNLPGESPSYRGVDAVTEIHRIFFPAYRMSDTWGASSFDWKVNFSTERSSSSVGSSVLEETCGRLYFPRLQFFQLNRNRMNKHYPVANGQQVSTGVNHHQPLCLLDSVHDDDGDELKHFHVISLPTNGTVDREYAQWGFLNYNPNNGFEGTDSFTFTVSDGEFESQPATIDIDVSSDYVIQHETRHCGDHEYTGWY